MFILQDLFKMEIMSEKTKELFWRTGADGALELVDKTTGMVLEREKRKTPPKIGASRGPKSAVEKKTHHWFITETGDRVWVPKTFNQDAPNVYPYSRIVAEEVIRLIAEGKTVLEISKMEGMPPPAAIYYWKRRYQEFSAEMKMAREMRAEVFQDEAIQRAKDSRESTVHRDRLEVETLKWAAEVNDPNTYGKRTKVVGDPDQPLGFVVLTGVPDPEPAIPVEGRKLDEPGTEGP